MSAGPPTLLLEYVAQTGPFSVDRDGAVVRGVRVLGLASANGREYSREAVREALPLYQGKAVNADHPARPGQATPVGSRVGWLENVVQEADGGLRGDWHLLKSHPLTPVVLEVAERRPQLLGLSHNAVGRTRRVGGRVVVEQIESVQSVDLVADPATVAGLHEGRTMSVQPLREVIKALEAAGRKGAARALREVAEAGVMDPAADMAMPEAPAEGGDDADHEAALRQGFRGAVVAVLDDDGLDMKMKLKKIKDILKAEEKLLGNGGETEEADDTEEAATAEGRLREQYELRLKARDLCADLGVSPTKGLRKALDACTTVQEQRELIEEFKQVQGRPAGGARSAPPRQGQGDTARVAEGKAPADQKALAAWLKD